MKLYKRKRPRGFWTTWARPVGDDEHGSWLHLPVGSPWSSADNSGVLPFSVVVLLAPGRPWVAWWVDDAEDRRIEIDVCLPPERDAEGWSFVDLELDPVRHENGTVAVEDHDEFEVACRNGWISPEEATIALETASRMETALRERVEPWGQEGWNRLQSARS